MCCIEINARTVIILSINLIINKKFDCEFCFVVIKFVYRLPIYFAALRGVRFAFGSLG